MRGTCARAPAMSWASASIKSVPLGRSGAGRGPRQNCARSAVPGATLAGAVKAARAPFGTGPSPGGRSAERPGSSVRARTPTAPRSNRSMNGGNAPPTTTAPPETTEPKEKIVRSGGRSMAIYALLAVVIIVVAGLGAAYALGYIGKKSSSPPGSCGTGQTLTGAGANFIYPLVTKWELGYQQADDNMVSYSPIGAGTGITDLQDQTVDFAATDDPLNASEASALKGGTALT